MKSKTRNVDVICQHCRNGKVIPLRVRVPDNDGDLQTYTIKEYRDMSHGGCREMPDGVYVTDNTLVYECNIINFGRKQLIRLYYDPQNTLWKMTP